MRSTTSTPSATAAHPATSAGDTHHLSAKKFLLHLLEMIVAMAVGMVALHPLWMFGLDAVDATELMHNPYTGAMVMATDMTLAMSAWMKIRGHRRRPIIEMGAAMYLPFLVLFAPLALEYIDTDALMLWGHVLMLPAMAAVMLLRRHEYAQC